MRRVPTSSSSLSVLQEVFGVEPNVDPHCCDYRSPLSPQVVTKVSSGHLRRVVTPASSRQLVEHSLASRRKRSRWRDREGKKSCVSLSTATSSTAPPIKKRHTFRRVVKMVLTNANSNSCNTLIDLNQDAKNITVNCAARPTAVHDYADQLVRTEILLPVDDFAGYDDIEDNQCATRQEPPREHLYLPASPISSSVSWPSAVPIDRHLSAIPAVLESAEMLLANPPRLLSKRTLAPSCRVLNIRQGEVGHATSEQCSIIASDDATTCHIIALRSTLSSSPSSSAASSASTPPLASLAHIDKPSYEDCIRNMIQQHKSHHFQSLASNHADDDNSEEEKKSDDCDYQPLCNNNSRKIEMDLHILGGFDDEDNSSREISEFLFDLFARLASEEAHTIQFTLQTCAVTSMNDTGTKCPIGRGLGLDITSGQVFLAAVDPSVAGPALSLRSARLWSSSSSSSCKSTLAVVHTSSSDKLSIAPFKFYPIRDLDVILSLPDHVLLQYTSTSPDVETDSFCDNVRNTLRYMRDNKWYVIFGKECMTPVVYRRVAADNDNDGDNKFNNCNEWEVV